MRYYKKYQMGSDGRPLADVKAMLRNKEQELRYKNWAYEQLAALVKRYMKLINKTLFEFRLGKCSATELEERLTSYRTRFLTDIEESGVSHHASRFDIQHSWNNGLASINNGLASINNGLTSCR